MGTITWSTDQEMQRPTGSFEKIEGEELLLDIHNILPKVLRQYRSIVISVDKVHTYGSGAFFFTVVYLATRWAFWLFLGICAYSFLEVNNLYFEYFYGLYPVTLSQEYSCASLTLCLSNVRIMPNFLKASVSCYDALLKIAGFPVYIGITKLLKLDFTEFKSRGFQRPVF